MGEWRGVSLRQIAARELAPYRGPDDKLMTVNGDDCLAAAAAMLPVAMLSHELATNAAKHGALARSGQLRLRWEVDEMLLRILWTETGGATASEPPQRRGFGSRVIDSTVRRQLGDCLERSWSPAGLECRPAALARAQRDAAEGDA